jgi:hypothetical protein
MIRFPRHGLESAAVLTLKRGTINGQKSPFRRVRAREMCNWIDCDVVFVDDTLEGSESSRSSTESSELTHGIRGQICSKCKLVKV